MSKPWLLTFLFGCAVFVIGRFLQRKERKERTLAIALWHDSEDKLFRVAGVYAKERDAWKRIGELGAGTVQVLRLNEKVTFMHECEK